MWDSHTNSQEPYYILYKNTFNAVTIVCDYVLETVIKRHLIQGYK